MVNKEKIPTQQSLGLKISDKNDFSTFEIGSNQNTVQALKSAVALNQNEFFFVVGPNGSGKTHLLHALHQLAKEQSQDCFFIDLNLLKQLGPLALDTKIAKYIFLDNVDCIAKYDDLELSLFGFFNRWYDSGYGTLIMSSSASFDSIKFNKIDLNTRLSSGISLTLNYLNEQECVQALLKRTKARFVNLPSRTIAFLVRHCNHDMRSLVKILDTLENAQIEHTHELTIPFVKKILNLE